MRTIRRVGGLAVAGLLLGAVVGGTAASAQAPGGTPASYTGAAAGQALKLSGLGRTLTAGASEAKASSDGTSSAIGQGASPVAASTQTAANPPGETKPEACAATVPPAPLNTLLTLGLGCGSATATGSGLQTVARGTGEIAGLDVTLQTVLDGQLKPLTDPLANTVETVTNSGTAVCNPLPSPLKEACLNTLATADNVVESLVDTKTLSAEFGSSASGVAVNGTNVTSEATASGAIVRILPTPTLDGVALGEPIATITIARANAKVVCDVANGTATPSFDPALVRIKLAAPIVASIPNIPDLLPKVTLPGGEIDANVSLTNGELTVTPGSKVVILAGTPLQTEIVAGAGTATKNPDGSATAVSDGVKVHALQLAPAPLTGGLLFDLAHAEAAGACVAAVVEVPRAAPEVPQELPRTGGTPWLPIAGAAGLALAVITRRTLVRSN